MTQDLLQQIDDLVASKTFNLDALDGIKKLKDDLKKTLEDREALQRKYDGLYEAHGKQSDEIQRQSARIAELHKDLEASEAYRAKAREDIHQAEKHKAVAEAWKEAMQTVFRPSAVRETIHRSVPVAVPMNSNGYMGTVNTYPETTTTTKDEV